MADNGSIVIYESETGDVRLENGTVWLSQEQLSVLFSKSVSTINYHINNIFREGELNKDEVFRIIRITTPHGAIEGLTQHSDLFLYNLKVIIAVGYRVKSSVGTRFRQWATERLNEYIVKVFYRQVLDIYATSIDYDPKAAISIDFFKKVQNNIHYAVHGQTAAEVIYNIADAEKAYLDTIKSLENKTKN